MSLRSSLIVGAPPPRRCNKPRSFLQDCAKILASEEGGDFFSNEMRSAVTVSTRPVVGPAVGQAHGPADAPRRAAPLRRWTTWWP